jgi:hypothetical protein
MILDDLLRFSFRDLAMFILCCEFASAQRHALFCLRGLLEAIMTNLLQRGDDAAQQR